jgi:hypothetical protein
MLKNSVETKWNGGFRPRVKMSLVELFELPEDRKNTRYRLKLVYGGGTFGSVKDISTIFSEKALLQGVTPAIHCTGKGIAMTCDIDVATSYLIMVPPMTLVLFEADEIVAP